jgi:putative ABC transport system substrate-binding protein
MMRRRDFITLLGGVAAAWPLAARAQQLLPVIGWLSARSPATDAEVLALFRRELNESGYVEGRNVAIEYRWAEGHYDRLAALAADLVRRRVAAIVALGGVLPAQAAQAATSTIPIVFATGSDPVKAGLVSNFAHPDGNITGIAAVLNELGPKRLGLMHELLPNATTIGLLVNPNNPQAETEINETPVAAGAFGQQINVLNASTDQDINAAFTRLVQMRAAALLVATDPFFFSSANRLVGLAARYAIPAIYFRREFATAGGLITYGSSTDENFRLIGIYAARILKGEKPANLPVIQSTRFELVINMKTAKALGLTVPPTLLATADEVIE